ncbi:hypothetical protein BH10ACT3_BH10ACT3_01490 [soil metagenome]
MSNDVHPGSDQAQLPNNIHAWNAYGLSQWLVDERNAGHTPDSIAVTLVRSGWDADTAARTSLRSLRSADRQSLTYAALNVAAGVGALGVASAAHLVLSGNPNPVQLTWMLTIAFVAGPIALAVAAAARRVESRSRYVLWSASRRAWFGALAFCTGAVGIVRLLVYLFSAIATLTGASTESFSVVSAAQVVVTLTVAAPLFSWSFRQWRRSNLVISALSDRADDHAEPRTGVQGDTP